ncbi:hypothetical protein F511_41834 [Dorcoceras hygrometricum]|uniref:Uncharacterized protein n=1 Tax=Dorcoceras hygrometricum TaxID=472368 RepID=A0A2Z7CF84_9LAMI|nr:hypothetical protein F511_41834 [Dorcoceras hygrometricum]
MRIRPPELETSICDAKYHVSLSTISVLGKWVYLVTLAMSLFDLQDVRIAVGSLATLDLPMVVDLIGIYVLKGPYCTLTTTNWFLQALSVIPRGSWGDVARRFTMIRWAMQIDGGRLIPVVDLIGGSTAAYREEPYFPCEFSGWSQASRSQQAHWLRDIEAGGALPCAAMGEALPRMSRPCATRNMLAAAAAVRPPSSDVSGSDAMANFLLGLFGPVPGSP